MTKIAFIGAGNMASSLIGGLLRAGTPDGDLIASDPSATQLAKVAELGIETTPDNNDAAHGADAVVLAVKPQVMSAVVKGLAAALPRDALLLSIAAGVTTHSIAKWTRGDVAIVRCMPNTPALYGAGITALYATAHVSPQQRRLAAEILSAAGQVVWVDEESQLDAVTALSGSGPAYFFYLMEAMTAAGERLGLSADIASALTLATAYGSAVMARESGTDPAQLRVGVTSPGGTTERAVRVLDDSNVRATIEHAIEQAAIRSRELAEQFGK